MVSWGSASCGKMQQAQQNGCKYQHSHPNVFEPPEMRAPKGCRGMVSPMATRPPAEEVIHTNLGVNAPQGEQVSLLRPATQLLQTAHHTAQSE